MLGKLRKGTGEIGHSEQNASALDHSSQENQDLRLSRSLVGRVEEPKGVDQRIQPRLREHPTLEFGYGVFGCIEGVFGEKFSQNVIKDLFRIRIEYYYG